jgi:hypothetical protein
MAAYDFATDLRFLAQRYEKVLKQPQLFAKKFA